MKHAANNSVDSVSMMAARFVTKLAVILSAIKRRVIIPARRLCGLRSLLYIWGVTCVFQL